MNPKNINLLIMFHNNIPNAKDMLRTMYVDPENVNCLQAVDGIRNHMIRTNLHRTKKDYSGKPVISSIYLKGIEEKLLMPTISIPHEVEFGANLTLDLGGVSFTQKFRRREGYKDFDSVFFGGVLLEDTHHRIMQTYFNRNNTTPNVNANYPILTPKFVKNILEKGTEDYPGVNRNVNFQLLTETTNEHIKKVTNCGLILKRTATFFNKEKKEDISYYVITATGRVMVFEGEFNTFDTPDKTGYVLLTDPVKVKK